MFQPASLKGDSPTPIDERVRNRYLVIYLLIIIFSFIPCSLFEYWYFISFFQLGLHWIFFLLLPFNIFLLIYILQISAIIISFIFLTIVKIRYRPREGVFKRDISDKNYRFWNLRNMIKKWPLYIAASNPFPWLKNRFILRFFGTKIGSHGICDNSWISSEFVSIGRNVIIGMGSTVLSFGIEQDKFIIKKIIVEDNALIGSKSVLMPGTVMKENSKLSAHSYTDYNTILEKDSIYMGHPAKLKND